MCFAITTVTSPVAKAFKPTVVIEWFVHRHLDIHPSEADAFSIDAREISLAANASRKSAVEGVVPDVQLPHGWGVYSRDEVANGMSDVNNVLIRTDTIERRHLKSRQALGGNLQAPAAMCETDDATLFLAPLQNR